MDSENKQLLVERPGLAQLYEKDERELTNRSILSAHTSRREREESIREALREGIRKFEDQIDLLRRANADISAQLRSVELDAHDSQVFDVPDEDREQIVVAFEQDGQGLLASGDEEKKQTDRPTRAQVGIIFHGSSEQRLMFDQVNAGTSLTQQNLISTVEIQATQVHQLEVEQLEEWVCVIMLKVAVFLSIGWQDEGGGANAYKVTKGQLFLQAHRCKWEHFSAPFVLRRIASLSIRP
ncbi:hypothetical protein V5O48_014712 [Marasmius crinis-equi]|uniref:Uncharacterized protein n=1 Tax=Marasmius crinis-equi TaxID=585013 RepID=A0ABR3EWI3_9AGAR